MADGNEEGVSRGVGGQDGGEVPRAEPPPSTSLEIEWLAVKGLLRNRMKDAPYGSWIEPMAAASREGGVVTLSFPVSYGLNHVRDQYLPQILAAWRDRDPTVVRIELLVGRGEATSSGALEISADSAGSAARLPPPSPPGGDDMDADDPVAPRGSKLHADYSFATFIQGPTNRSAYHAAEDVIAAGGRSVYAPLFIYGPPGAGKTHIANATAKALIAAQPNLRVLYFTAEQFMYGFVTGVKRRDTMMFKEFCRRADVLIVDDLQHLDGRDKTQDELLHTVSELMMQHKQVILIATQRPAQLSWVDAYWRSRLEGGLCVEMMPPDLGVRREILRRMSVSAHARYGVVIAPEVGELLVRQVEGDCRRFVGALNNVIHLSRNRGAALTVEEAAMLLEGAQRQVGDRRITMDLIHRVVAARYGVKVTELVSERRTKDICHARQVAIYLCHRLTDRPYTEIGRRCGRRNHATIIHSIKKIERLLESDAELQRTIEDLTRLILDHSG